MEKNAGKFAAILLSAATVMWHPSAAAQQTAVPSAPAANTTIQVGTDALLVTAVVRDALGHAVSNLTQADFKIFDQGKPEPLTGFSLISSSSTQSAAGPAVSGSNAPAAVAVNAPAQSLAQLNFTVFLFDDRHLEAAPLGEVKEAAARLFDQPLAQNDRAVVLSFLGVNSGITRDSAVLKAAVMKLKAKDHAQGPGRECPSITYYQADQIENQHSQIAFNAAFADAEACSSLQRGTGGDPGWVAAQQQLVRQAASRVLQLGDADARETLNYIRDVVGTMSKLPGERTLVLISPGFLSSSTDAMNISSQVIDSATYFHVTISALDARGVTGQAFTASQHGSFGAATTGQNIQDNSDSEKANKDVMADLAASTGGTFFHNNNDLESGLRTLTASPEYHYLLQISLKNVKKNGTYHKLEVKVNQSDLTVQARRGYFAPAPLKNKK